MDDKQLDVVQTVEAMFRAAPGARYLNEFVAFIKNTGSSVKELANNLAQTAIFKQSLYSDTLSNSAFAHQFVENTVGILVNQEDKAWAAAEIEKMLDAGESRGEIIHWAATALASIGTDNTHWGAAAQQFNNKVEVAAYYSIDQGGSATNLAVLQHITADVTSDISSVASAKAVLKSGVSGKIIDGYIKDAIVFSDLNGDGIHNSNESSTTSDTSGNFVLPGVNGFGQLIVSGGIDISTGIAFTGSMTAPPGSTVITPLTTLIDKLTQNNVMTVEDASAKVLASLGLHPGIDLLHFDPIYETSRTDTDKATTGIALAIHTAAVKVSILISQTGALLSGAGVLANEAAAIDLAYEALAASLVSNTGLIDLSANNTIAQIIQDTTELSGANNSVLFKIGALATDASQAIANLNKAVASAATNNADKSNILSTIAAAQIVSEHIESMMKSGAATGNIENTVGNTTGSTLVDAITIAGTTVGDVTGDGLPDPLPLPPAPSTGGGGGGTSTPTTVQSYLATSTTAFSGTSANDILSISTATTWTPLVMTTVILDGSSGTNTLSVQDGSNITSAIVINFPSLTFDATGVTGTNDVTMSASQNQLFTGTITAAGTGANGEKITIISDGAITTLTDVENYTAGDDSTNARTITVSNAGANVTASSTTDAITFNLGTLTYTGTITGDNTVDDALSLSTGANLSGGTITNVEALTLTSGASITLSASQNQNFTGTITAAGTGVSGEKITTSGDGAVTALSNIETYELGDDTTNARTLTTGSTALNLIANNATDTVTINATALAQNTELTIAAASTSALVVTSLVGDMVASNLSGTLAVTTANAADNGISITTGTAATSVNVAAGAASDTVSINAAALTNNIGLTITSGGAAAGTVNITNLSGDMTVSNPTSGTIGVTVTDNAVDDGIAIAAGAANLAISGVADGDTVTITGFTGTTLSGAIANTTGKFNITTGTSTSSITTGAGDDTFTFVAGTGLTSADTVNGGTGTDTVALTSNTAIAATNFNSVSNIEVITIANTNTTVAITTQDTLVASGATLTLSNAANSGVLTFIGSTETNGKFNITGGTGIDSITGGAGDDTFTFVAGTGLTTDTVNGGTGTDTVTLTGTTAVTAAQFNNVSNIEAITLPSMVNTAIAITTVDALVAAGATLTLSNAANAGILTFNGAAETNGAFSITGGTSNDAITGGSGNDALTGGTGNDSITAGLGNDTLTGNSGNDTFTLAAVSGLTSGDTVDGGAGSDTVALTGNTAFTAATDFYNVSNIEVITLANTTTAVTITTQDILVAAGAALTLQATTLTTGILTFNGSAETDGTFNITGGGAADVITGGAGNDIIDGGAGNNVITASLGNDTITGGSGSETFTFAAATGLTSADIVDGSSGTDTVALTGNTAFTASNDFDSIRNIEAITLANTNTAVTITTKDILVASSSTLTLTNAANSGVLTFIGSAETDGTFTINGGTGNDSITSGAGNDSITGNAGADTITLGSSANDNTRQTVIDSSVLDGAAAGASSGADAITQFDANANDATDDLLQITGTLKTMLDDDSDGILDYSTSDGADLGNQAIVGGVNQEATVLFDTEIEIALAAFTTPGLANVLGELAEEIDFSAVATGEEHLFIINFSATQTAMVLYTAGSGGDDTIVATDIQVLGIVTHNDGTGLVTDNLTF